MDDNMRICSSQKDWILDNPVRRFLHNPYKILGKYLEEGQTALDLGSGPGVFSLAMAELVGEKGKVISVDVQEEMLRILKQKSERTGLRSRIILHKAQPEKIGLAEKVDFALAFYMVHEVPDKEKFLREVVSLLKPNARFLIVEPKLHVSKSAFDDTIKVARSAGLRPISEPEIFFSRAVLLEPSSILGES